MLHCFRYYPQQPTVFHLHLPNKVQLCTSAKDKWHYPERFQLYPF